ncbi:MAG: aspartyl protease family protein, partial [Polyangiaceae bacterium]
MIRHAWTSSMGALIAVGCAGGGPAATAPPCAPLATAAAPVESTTRPQAEPASAAPRSLRLAPYQSHGHRTVEVMVDGAPIPFLFDTGGGVSFVSPAVAERVGCAPGGQLVGYRMRGDDVRFPRCEGLALEVDGLRLTAATVGVFDLGKLLPPEWPRLGGLIALSSFEGRVVTLDLAAGQVDVDAPPPATSESTAVNLVRQASGFSVVVVVPVPSSEGTLWLELDSGSSAPLILAPHAARALGMDAEGEGAAGEVMIELPNVGAVTTAAKVTDMIYDGYIGAPLMERF